MGRPEAPASGERLQKALAGPLRRSRRQVEELVRAGRVRVNGRVAELGARVQPGDRVELDGDRVQLPRRAATPRVLAYHKPEGELCSRRAERGRRTVYESLPPGPHWLPVGRLDLNSSGLLLFTDDGGLANRMAHPSGGLDREYMVRVRPRLTEAQTRQLLQGIELDDGPARCTDLVAGPGSEGGDNQWYCLVVMEGRTRLVRRMFEALGCQVSRLMRVRYGPVQMGRERRPGKHWHPPRAQLRELGQRLGVAGLDAGARSP